MERVYRLVRGRVEEFRAPGPEHRVPRDEVDSAVAAFEELRESVAVLRAVVDAAQEDVLHKSPLAAQARALVHRRHELVERVGGGGRDDLAPELLRRRVERKSETRVRDVARKIQHARDDAHRAHRDAALRERKVRAQSTDRCEHRVVVVQRLSHPHKDDVTDVRRVPHRVRHLLQNLPCREIALKAHRTCGAKGASHLAPRL
mmetsp:Transcript_12366/g.40695  ORF Transcript_12366/g.40695 Transcript_12366/m.40695 type:complete len:203 (-) Transcript_12366:459-1067(-)